MRRIVYATQSEYKRAELDVFLDNASLSDGARVHEEFRFDTRSIALKEVLEVDLVQMVTAEVQAAYGVLREPCIVEHAGLVFNHRLAESYPGGLTKPMWNALGDDFITETQAAGRKALARAVIGYCDGRTVSTFVGETRGRIADAPRGSRHFYWDTIFMPDSPDAAVSGKTYAEIVDDQSLGLKYKVLELSQSFKAMRDFLEFRRSNEPDLWYSRYA